MMETQSTGAGRFAQFDLTRVPSPCFVVDEVKLRENLELLKGVSEASGAQILMALKAFSMWSLAPDCFRLFGRHLRVGPVGSQAGARPLWRQAGDLCARFQAV